MSDVNAGGSVDVDEADSWVRSWVPLTAALSARRDAATETFAHDLDRGWLLMAADAGEPLRALGNPPERRLEIQTTNTKLQIDEI
jgi:hypothetical protein